MTSHGTSHGASHGASAPQDIVGLYLRAQNLEHVRRVDEATALYEEAVAAGFDAVGPYDRLIAIYHARNDHAEVARVAEAAVAHVRTYDEKRAWYRSVLDGARAAIGSEPDRRGSEFSF